MNHPVFRQMIAADILKLRRHRGTMVASLALTIGVTLLYFATIRLRHGSGFPGAQTLSDGTSLMGIYFGSFAAVLIGTEAGSSDLASGVFRDLVATGRARTTLFLTRIPAAIAVALVFTLSGFLITAVASFWLRGAASAPGLGLLLQSAGWVALATIAVTSLAVSVASVTGSRSLTLTAVIAWQTIASALLYSVGFLGSLRDGLLVVALSALRPGLPYGTVAHPGSSNALPGLIVPMAPTVAILVILVWAIAPLIVGAWWTSTRDA